MREYWVRLLRWLAQLKEGFALSLTQASNAPPLPSVQRAAAGAHPPVRPPPPSLPPLTLRQFCCGGAEQGVLPYGSYASVNKESCVRSGSRGSRAEQSSGGAEQQYLKPRLTTEGVRRTTEK
jgi:hypothetical protein